MNRLILQVSFIEGYLNMINLESALSEKKRPKGAKAEQNPNNRRRMVNLLPGR